MAAIYTFIHHIHIVKKRPKNDISQEFGVTSRGSTITQCLKSRSVLRLTQITSVTDRQTDRQKDKIAVVHVHSALSCIQSFTG